jgi:hypothetical protein
VAIERPIFGHKVEWQHDAAAIDTFRDSLDTTTVASQPDEHVSPGARLRGAMAAQSV